MFDLRIFVHVHVLLFAEWVSFLLFRALVSVTLATTAQPAKLVLRTKDIAVYALLDFRARNVRMVRACSRCFG